MEIYKLNSIPNKVKYLRCMLHETMSGENNGTFCYKQNNKLKFL